MHRTIIYCFLMVMAIGCSSKTSVSNDAISTGTVDATNDQLTTGDATNQQGREDSTMRQDIDIAITRDSTQDAHVAEITDGIAPSTDIVIQIDQEADVISDSGNSSLDSSVQDIVDVTAAHDAAIDEPDSVASGEPLVSLEGTWSFMNGNQRHLYCFSPPDEKGLGDLSIVITVVDDEILKSCGEYTAKDSVLTANQQADSRVNLNAAIYCGTANRLGIAALTRDSGSGVLGTFRFRDGDLALTVTFKALSGSGLMVTVKDEKTGKLTEEAAETIGSPVSGVSWRGKTYHAINDLCMSRRILVRETGTCSQTCK